MRRNTSTPPTVQQVILPSHPKEDPLVPESTQFDERKPKTVLPLRLVAAGVAIAIAAALVGFCR